MGAFANVYIDPNTYTKAIPKTIFCTDARYNNSCNKALNCKNLDDAVCSYFKGLIRTNDEVFKSYTSDEEAKIAKIIKDKSESICKVGKNNTCVPKLNVSMMSNIERADKNSDCQNYTYPKRIIDSKCQSGGNIKECLTNNTMKKTKFEEYFEAFFKGKDCVIDNIKYREAPTSGDGCYIDAVSCKDFFVDNETGTLKDIHYPGLIKVLANTKDLKTCRLYVATISKDGKQDRYIYDDDIFAWLTIKDGANNSQPKYMIDKEAKVIRIENDEIKNRAQDLNSKTPDDYCSENQIVTLKQLAKDDVTNNALLTDIYEKYLAHLEKDLFSAYVSEAPPQQSVTPEQQQSVTPEQQQQGKQQQDQQQQSQAPVTASDCESIKPKPENFKNTTNETLQVYCDRICPADISSRKNCINRCIEGKDKSSVLSKDANGSVIPFDTKGYTYSGKTYTEAYSAYDECLVKAGKKMSKEKKWETGLTTSGMAANLLMGLYGMYSTSSMNDDNFMLQIEMLKRSDQCYSLNPEQSVISNTKKRSFFGWIFSGMKSTFKEEQPYKKLSEVDETTHNKLKQTYSIKNPVTGVSEDMTAYDICVLNKALSSMNQSMQNQMLCNQLMGMGIINQREYKACMMGKDLKYGTGGNTPFAKAADKPAPPTPDKKKEEDPKKDDAKKDDKAAPATGGGGTPGSTPSASNKETPDYMRNYPYYKSSNRGGGNLGYSDGKQPYYGGGDAGTAGQNSVDLKAGTGTGADAGTAGNFLIDNLPGINSTTYNSISSGRKQ